MNIDQLYVMTDINVHSPHGASAPVVKTTKATQIDDVYYIFTMQEINSKVKSFY